MKPTRRKGFNFYRSYYDVFNKLPTDKDKLEFVTILLDKQFLDADPSECSMIVEFAYESQLHSITKQVKGWKDATNLEITEPCGTPQGVSTTIPKGDKPKEVQEKEEEKVKVKEERVYSDEIINFTQTILKHFPIKPKKIEDWYRITDELIRIDKFNLESIKLIVETFTADGHFWRKNFQTYAKLRKTNKEGVKYIEFFKNTLIAEKNQPKKPTHFIKKQNDSDY